MRLYVSRKHLYQMSIPKHWKVWSDIPVLGAFEIADTFAGEMQRLGNYTAVEVHTAKSDLQTLTEEPHKVVSPQTRRLTKRSVVGYTGPSRVGIQHFTVFTGCGMQKSTEYVWIMAATSNSNRPLLVTLSAPTKRVHDALRTFHEMLTSFYCAEASVSYGAAVIATDAAYQAGTISQSTTRQCVQCGASNFPTTAVCAVCGTGRLDMPGGLDDSHLPSGSSVPDPSSGEATEPGLLDEMLQWFDRGAAR